MNLKRSAIICGIAVIPLWYVYRSVGEHRAIRSDEIFADEATILRHELEETKKQAAKDLEDAKLENAPEARQRFVASKAQECLKFAKEVRTKYSALIAAQSTWAKELQELKHSRSGAVIASNEDYVRVFRSFDDGFTSDTDLQNFGQKIDSSEQICRDDEKNRPTEWVAGSDAFDKLAAVDREMMEQRSKLERARTNFLWLAHVATGESLDPLDLATGRQHVSELVQILKATEEREVMHARYH